MKRTLLLFFCIFGTFFLPSCATTTVTSFKDPAYTNKIYQKIAIFSSSENLETRQLIENSFLSWLNGGGTSATCLINLYPPTRTFNFSEIKQQLKDSGFDALLIVNLTGAYNDVMATPGYSSTVWGKRGATTIFSGPGQISKPRVTFNLELLDLATDQKAWVSSTFTAGNAFANKSILITSLAQKTVNKMAEDRLILMKTADRLATGEENSQETAEPAQAK